MPNFSVLDDERDRRNQEMLKSIGQFGDSLVSAPLTYQSLMAEQANRANKMAMDKQDLLNKQQQLAREKSMTDKENFDLGESQDKAKEAKQNEAITNFVHSKLADKNQDGSEKTFDQVMTDFGTHPEQLLSTGAFDDQNGVDLDKLRGKVGDALESARQEKFKEGIAQEGADTKKDLNALKEKLGLGGLAVKQENADTLKMKEENRAKRSALAVAKTPRPANLPASAADKLSEIQTTMQNIGDVQRYKDQNDVTTGPVSGVMLKLRQLSHTMSPQQAAMSTELHATINQTLHDLSGAQVTPSEYARLIQMLPSQYDEEDTYNAITEMAQEMAQRRYNNLLDTFTKSGYKTNLTHVDNKGNSAAPAGSPMNLQDATSKAMQEHPELINDRPKLKALIKQLMSGG